MIYKEFGQSGVRLSTLGLGCMRFPMKGGEVDRKKTFEIIEAAYRGGINYFDTAYVYLKGQSETVIGEALKQFPRETWHLADKFPGYHHPKGGWSRDKVREIFEEQLKKCQVDYFDFYMLHNVFESLYDIYTNDKVGMLDYLKEQKAAGRIRFLGISAHANPTTLEQFLDWAGPCLDFVQIQLNYLDWTLQEAKKKYEMLTARGIPVIVMEPVRGGKLAKLDKKNAALFKKAEPDASIASWAFDWLRTLPNVSVILSGMSDMAQLQDNLKTFDREPHMTEEKRKVLSSVVHSLTRGVPCTSCRYCCDGCPKGLDIPRLLGIYNEGAFRLSAGRLLALGSIEEKQAPSNCIQCGKCKTICPQNIDIPAIMKKFSRREGLTIRASRAALRLYKKKTS